MHSSVWKIFNFLKNRIKKGDFLWLSATILFFLIVYVLTEYIWFTDAVLDWDLITKIDTRLSEFFFYFKDKRLIDFFLFISYFWNVITVSIVLVITSFILFSKQKIFEIIWLFTSVFISGYIAFLSKIIISRARPDLAVYQELGYSFPSFHATISIALYGFVIWLLLVWVKKWKSKFRFIILWIIIAFLIGLSRLYLNVHYLSDVISGWFLWFLGLTLWITITCYLKHIYTLKHKQYLTKKTKKIIIFLIISWIIFSIFNYIHYYNNIKFLDIKEEKYIQIDNIYNIFSKNPHLRFTETITWRSTEPINFVFMTKNPKKIPLLFKESLWYWADKLWRSSIKNMWEALFIKKKYETAPITPLYWNKDIQVYAFQKHTKENTIKLRHHIRIWNTYYKVWDYFIFVWTWIYDDWIKWGITHRVDPDIDKEREYIFNTLKGNTLIQNIKLISLEKPFKWKNFSWDEFFTDGKAYIIKIN